MMRVRSLLVLSMLSACIGCVQRVEVLPTRSFRDCVAGFASPGDGAAPEIRRLAHQVRNMGAMVDLVSELSPPDRPRTILYLASGDHLGPLGLCDLIAQEEDCRFVFTEVDVSVQEGIQEGLAELDRRSCLRLLDNGRQIREPSGRRTWEVQLGGRRVSIELRVAEPGSPESYALLSPELLSEVDLVISHDWSGEPIGNLQVIHEFVVAARGYEDAPPFLMIEDLEAHLFPVDLGAFVRRAATSRPYGHRGSDGGPGMHGRVELGAPVFGGAVLLDFSELWWREIDEKTLRGFFDFLLINEFDVDRRNVLTGGSQPLVAPVLLDWWTGYGARGIDGALLDSDDDFRTPMIDAAVEVAGVAGSPIQERVACRLRLYSCLLAIRAAGEDTLDLMPIVTSQRDGTTLLTQDMDRLFRQALRRAGEFRAEREAFSPIAARLLDHLHADSAAGVVADCAVGTSVLGVGELRSAYREIQGSLALSRQ